MRSIVILQPTNRHGTKTAYTKFRAALLEDGFERIGLDIFMRVDTNRKTAEKRRRRMANKIPETGRILMFTMTEKQWKRIEYLTGEPGYQEEAIGGKCNILL